MLNTLSVTQLSNYVTNIFEAEELLHNIKVFGEVSGLSNVRGNLYFTLKDEQAIMPCIMFGASDCNIKDGDQILASGSLKYYGKGGKLNFYVVSAVPYGSGVLYQRYIELKNKLELEGLFDKKYKKELPSNIKKIGVITSKTGAVIHDIETVSHRRNPTLNIDVYPAKVQGVGAEYTIIRGLEYFDRQEDIDVIIIARGGGSIEDFQPFNTEALARAIIKVGKPVVSAVGHEPDYTICDFASSIRAATPSMGAELVAKNIYDDLDKIKNNINRITYLVTDLINDNYLKLDDYAEKFTNAIYNKIDAKKNKLNDSIKKLSLIANNLFVNKKAQLDINNSKVVLLNPLDNINRGWVKVRNSANKYLKDINEVNKEDDLTIELLNGEADVKVIKIKKELQ